MTAGLSRLAGWPGPTKAQPGRPGERKRKVTRGIDRRLLALALTSLALPAGPATVTHLLTSRMQDCASKKLALLRRVQKDWP
jgi:hypothetical protein